MKKNKIIGFKGFNKDMTCRDFQYKEGKTYKMKEKPEICEKGFHFCEYPLDCLGYYSPNSSVYHEVTATGDVDKKTSSDDSKVATNEIKIGAKLDIAGLVKASIDYTTSKSKKVKGSTTRRDYGASSATGDYGASSATGNHGASSATGDFGASSATGNHGASSATGYCGASSATGNHGASSATGDFGASSATGDCGASSATGNHGASSATGYCGASLTTGLHGSSSAGNKTAVAVAWGYEGKAKGVKGSYIVCAEWKFNFYEREWIFIQAKMAQVDGVKIKENTYYSLENGKFVEKGKEDD